MPYLEIAVIVISAYLIGSISSAIIVCRVMGLPDPRTQGSQNPGATNVLRIGGKKAAIITLFGDLLKGLLPVIVVRCLSSDANVLALVAFAAFIGHLFPIFFRFAGGKGVATALGCLLGLAWPVGLSWIASWLVVALLFRYVSLASLLASLLAPLYMWYFTGNIPYVCTVALMSGILVVRHRSNIVKLLAGVESKIGKKK